MIVLKKMAWFGAVVLLATMFCAGLALAGAAKDAPKDVTKSAPSANDAAKDTEKQIEKLVREAVQMVFEQGDAAYAQFRKPDGKWYDKERFFFVSDDKGVDLVNPTFPELEGKNLWDMKDPKGRYPVREEIALVKAQNHGWIDVLWNKPGEKTASKARTYVMGVEIKGRLLMVGAGYFVK